MIDALLHEGCASVIRAALSAALGFVRLDQVELDVREAPSSRSTRPHAQPEAMGAHLFSYAIPSAAQTSAACAKAAA